MTTIDAIAALAARGDLAGEAMRPESAGTDLYKTLAAGLEQLNSDVVKGQGALQGLALGDMDNLHQLVMGMERARLQFDLLMSARNRVLEAYQEILRLQI
jgi:flagellar hook-basal body complex protein FliE